jgi:hypothetical protein
MKKLTIIIWPGFITLFLIFLYYQFVFRNAVVEGIIPFEFANAINGKRLLDQWEAGGLLSIACWMIILDFAYIFFYVAIIITLSNKQIRKEPSIELNALLRANFFFAFFAGFLDVIENIGLLYNIHYWKTSYFNVSLIAWLKFILIAWAILIWLISLIKSKINN